MSVKTEEPPRIQISVDLRQVKINDQTLVPAEAMTVWQEEKKTFHVPFESPVVFTYNSLMDDFVFKFAILHDEELIGVLYLEIPYRYKFSKRFKIDDWFVVKPFEKTGGDNNSVIRARVVLKYSANCRLSQDVMKNLAEVEITRPASPKREFKAKLRDMNRSLQDHEKEGFSHLEDVEKKIRARRLKGSLSRTSLDPRGENKENRIDSSAKVLGYTLTRKKQMDLGPRSRSTTNIKTRQFNAGEAVTPDDLFRATIKGGKSTTDLTETDNKLFPKMAKEMTILKEEITSLRSKLRGLEEGNMTVDNLKLSKQLDREKDDLNKERANLLRTYATKSDKLEEERKRLQIELKRKEDEAEKKRQEAVESLKKMEADRVDLDDKLKKCERRSKDLDEQQRILDQKIAKVQEEIEKLAKERTNLGDYAAELDVMKDNLLKEREKLMKEKSNQHLEKSTLEQQIKELKLQKAEIEKQKEKELKEIAKKHKELEEREEKLNHELEDVLRKRAELETMKDAIEKGRRENSKLKNDAEEHNLALWRDRNQLNQEVKQFIEDRKMMENDIKWQKTELDEAYKELDQDKEDLEKEREELDKYKEELENMKMDLETRERLLMHEQENFMAMKKRFLDKIMESGNWDKLTPEMKLMAREMGIDVDEMIEENKRLQQRREQLDRLKQENDDQLAKIKQLANSKRASRMESRRASMLKKQDSMASGDVANVYTRKMAAKDYLSDLYDLASTKFLMKEMEETKKALEKTKEELHFSTSLIDTLRNDNKSLKKELDTVLKIVDQIKSSGKFDLNAFLGREVSAKEVQTDLEFSDNPDLEARIRELEVQLKKAEAEGGSRRADHADLDENNLIWAKDIQRELQQY